MVPEVQSPPAWNRGPHPWGGGEGSPSRHTSCPGKMEELRAQAAFPGHWRGWGRPRDHARLGWGVSLSPEPLPAPRKRQQDQQATPSPR